MPDDVVTVRRPWVTLVAAAFAAALLAVVPGSIAAMPISPGPDGGGCEAHPSSQVPDRSPRGQRVQQGVPSGARQAGLSGGSYLVKDINTSGDSSPFEITQVGDVAFFVATGPGGREPGRATAPSSARSA